jgi:hypothetical protein
MYLGKLSPHQELNPDMKKSYLGVREELKNPKFSDIFVLLGGLLGGESLSDLPELTQEMLTCPPFLKYFFMEAKSYKEAWAVAPVAVMLCGDLKTTGLVVEAIETGFGSKQHDALRPYFRVIKVILDIEDSHQEVRVDMFMSMLERTLTNPQQQKYWKIIDFEVDHVIRLAKRNTLVAQWLHNKQKLLDDLLIWFATNEDPPRNKADVMQADRKPLEQPCRYALPKSLAQQEVYKFSQTTNWGPYHISVADKVAMLELLKSSPDALSEEDASDSDRDLCDRKYALDDQVEVRDDRNDWLACTIVKVFTNGYVRIHYNGYKDDYDENIDVGSNRLAPIGSFEHFKPKKPKV